MKNLIASRNLWLFITIPSPILPKPPSLHQQKKWKIHSSPPKGFTSKLSTTTKNAKTIQTEEFPRKFSGDSQNNDDDDKIPDSVFKRMISRILFYTGVPMGIGLVLLQIIGIVKENNLWNVPTWVPFLTTFIFFGSSVLGIAYGTLSTSLDPEEKGSVLGFDEAQKNWVEMWKEDS